ncbi:MAG: hypothetical protein IPM77_14575 [Crocinitomicaceae bacterium]|nr:hypothetical protein [Crocinitomicaceae bacterium]
MKKAILFTLTLAALTVPAIAQPPTYDDLLIYYADGDYEKLLKKAESYTLKDDTKNDALPYLYLSKANFEMSKDQIWLNDYPKAWPDAINYAGSCIKKDKDSTIYRENIKYFTELKTAIVEEIMNLVETGNYPKLMGTIPKLHKIDRNDVGSYFLKAAAEYNNGDKGTAKETQKEAFTRLANVKSVAEWREVDLAMLKLGIIEYCKAVIKLNQRQLAVDTLGKVKQWFEEDEEFMEYYNSVIN